MPVFSTANPGLSPLLWHRARSWFLPIPAPGSAPETATNNTALDSSASATDLRVTKSGVHHAPDARCARPLSRSIAGLEILRLDDPFARKKTLSLRRRDTISGDESSALLTALRWRSLRAPVRG